MNRKGAAPTLGEYVTGLMLALVLTAIPFAATALQWGHRRTLIGLIAGTAILQVVVHLRFFLHLSLDRASRDRLLILLFTLLLLLIMIVGTLIVMASLDQRMM